MSTTTVDARTVRWLNHLAEDSARDEFRKCCGAEWWYTRMTTERPFENGPKLIATADRLFDSMPRDAWLEAFACHPKIGDLDSLRMRFAGNREWSGGEQSGVQSADERTLMRLAELNEDYLEQFGYLFIVCATGKSATEMLALLESRLRNEPGTEFPVACSEQSKISHLRLGKLTQPTP